MKEGPMLAAHAPRSSTWRRVGSLLLAAVAWAGTCGGAAETDTAAAEDEVVVSLPPLLVEAQQSPLRWRYVAAPGVEVLSVCDDDVTRGFVQRRHHLDQVLHLLVPERFQGATSVPEIQILFNEDLRRARSQEVMTEMLRRHEPGAPDTGPIGTPLRGPREPVGGPLARRRVLFLPNLRLGDMDATAVFAATNADDPRHLEFTFVVDRIAYLLARRVPALPDWFMVGTVGVYARCQMSDEAIEISPALWLSEEESRALRSDPDRPRTLLPIAELLTRRRPRPEAAPDPLDAIWRVQCALFVRWAVAEQGGAHKEGLWTLAERLAREPLSEALFQECLGIGYADMRDRLSDYLPVAVAKNATLRATGRTDLPDLKMRPATEVEIARIRGDWERMQIGYVKQSFPDLTGKYVEQARRTLAGAYERGIRDPRVLGLVGLTECDAGNPVGARAYLEAAARGGVERPRVYLELALLRFEERRELAPDLKLDAAAVAAILEPLQQARQLQPPLVRVYALLADLWTHSAQAPAPEELAILREGVNYFPQSVPLVVRVIYLHAANGQPEHAVELARLGLRCAADAESRATLQKLCDQLDAVIRR